MSKIFSSHKQHDYVPEVEKPFKKGIDHQREIYKDANLRSDYELMVKTLENIKMEIKRDVIAKGNKEKIVRVENIIDWYNMIPLKYTKQTEEGKMLVLPANIRILTSKNLNIAYEILLEQLSILRLL